MARIIQNTKFGEIKPGFSPRAMSLATATAALEAADAGGSASEPCKGEGGRGYIGAEKHPASPTLDLFAGKATITTMNPDLACEDTGVKFRAVSAAWLTIGEEKGVWAQMGWAKERKEGEEKDTRFVYCELAWGDGKDDTHAWKFADPGDGAHDYRMELDRTTGIWTYYFDGNAKTLSDPPYPEAAKARMKDFTGFGFKVAGEIVDKKSHMPGTKASHCVFSVCFYKNNTGAAWIEADFASWDPEPTPNWKNNIDGNKLEIWDTR